MHAQYLATKQVNPHILKKMEYYFFYKSFNLCLNFAQQILVRMPLIIVSVLPLLKVTCDIWKCAWVWYAVGLICIHLCSAGQLPNPFFLFRPHLWHLTIQHWFVSCKHFRYYTDIWLYIWLFSTRREPLVALVFKLLPCLCYLGVMFTDSYEYFILVLLVRNGIYFGAKNRNNLFQIN